MASTLQLILSLGMAAMCLANPANNVRWCVKSDPEMKKCQDVSKACASDHITLTCVRRVSTEDCFRAISGDQADAITLDSGHIYKASQLPYDLIPVAAENYGTEKEPNTCYYSVAVVKKSSNFMIKELEGKRSCHTAVGRAAGWVSPCGTLIALGLVKWDGPESSSVEKAMAMFFSAACAPGSSEPNLCKQCDGKQDKKCAANEHERYYGYSGAMLCLIEDKGDVAFVKHIIPEEYHKYIELLCLDGTRKSLEEYEKCYWGRVGAHAVVTANRKEKAKLVIQFLEEAQKKAECKLFSSPHGKDLMFKDSANGILPVPESMDAALYLGQSFSDANKALYQVSEPPPEDTIRWCTQSVEEKNKCDDWSIASEGSVECIEASNAEECIRKVLKGEADAVTLDGGYLYTAGACGLVPAMQEIYNAEDCKRKKGNKKSEYFAVAVVKKSNKEISWKNLEGFKSCHTALGRSVGYNIPVGLIHKEKGVCDLGTIFKQSCIPGDDPTSTRCQLCAGNEKTKCLPNNREPYFDYEGALKCLVQVGDVAFVKQSTLSETIECANSPAWAKDLKKDDFELLCLDDTRRPVDDYEECNLAKVPAHGIATTLKRKSVVVRIINEQQERFGKDAGSDAPFHMFVSKTKRNQLFKDSTYCLSEVKENTMNEYLGKGYTEAIANLHKCVKPSGLLAACTFHTCKVQ